LRQLAGAPVDVLLTDLNLPGGMDGAALARLAREMLPHLAVVYASAKIASLAPEARVPGALLLRKPYEPGMLRRLIVGAAQAEKQSAFA
jgi:two-component system, response regulator PdtaR